jgi:prepilin-type N-terminal cleavage/methylation domain-containing protein
MGRKTAFTLVELLVVIAIIVLLLALLAPALDRAMYSALLVNCSANQRRTAMTAIDYAFAQRRAYPSRPVVPVDDEAGLRSGISPWAVYLPPYNVRTGYDMRPVLREKMNLDPNTASQCPLIEPINFDERLADEFVYGNTALWFDWGYLANLKWGINENVQGQRARALATGTELERMSRLGDRFEWAGKRYNLLVSDIDLYRYWNNGGGCQTAHPDAGAGLMYNAVVIRLNIIAEAAYPHTASFWHGPDSRRGGVDHNYAYDDGSVRLVTGIARQDPRLDRVPVTFDNRSARDVVQVPPQ